MTWSPPQSWFRPAAWTITASLAALSGCASLSVPSAASVATDDRAASIPATRVAMSPPLPEFDVLRDTPQLANAAPSSVVASSSLPAAVAGAAAKASGNPVEKNLASTLKAPQPFAWENAGKSAGGRAIQTTRIGEDGYRTLIVGSVAGDDPRAIELVDLLARRLHDNQAILGGFDCTIVRTLNPDGAANRKLLNDAGVYLNQNFPASFGKTLPDRNLPGANPPSPSSAVPGAAQVATTGPASQQPNVPGTTPAEIAFLLDRVQQIQPQRVLHIRTIDKARGIIGSGSSSRTTADEAAQWLNFSRVDLAAKSSPGSLERLITSGGSADMITIAIPADSKSSELWTRYGDTLLNLLLGDDLATREIARQNLDRSSADRRNRDAGK